MQKVKVLQEIKPFSLVSYIDNNNEEKIDWLIIKVFKITNIGSIKNAKTKNVE